MKCSFVATLLIIALFCLLIGSYFLAKIWYYSGIQDYCSKVTIIDVSTGGEINRTNEYCDGLTANLERKNFFEKYHFPILYSR